MNLKNIFSNDLTQKEKLSYLEKTLIQNSKIKAELLWIKMEQSSLNFTKTNISKTFYCERVKKSLIAPNKFDGNTTKDYYADVFSNNQK